MKRLPFSAPLCALALLLLCGIAQAQVTVGYTTWSGTTGAVTTLSTTAGTTQATGSTFALVVVNTPAATSIPTITDNMGNNSLWLQASTEPTYPGQPRSLTLYYCINCAGGTGHVVTATWTGVGAGSIGLAEFKNVGAGSFGTAPAGVQNSTGTGPIVAPSLTTGATNMLVVDVMGSYNSNITTLGDSGAPWSIAVSQGGNTAQNGAIAWQLVSSSGTAVSDTFSYSTSDYYAALSMSIRTSTSSVSCSHAGYTSAGASAVPNGTTGSYWVKTTGAFGTPDCAATNYWQPPTGNFAVN